MKRTKPWATLVTFATGEVFERYASALLQTAEQWFFPGHAQLLTLQTTPVFPLSIRDRHTHILKARRRVHGRFVMLLDADMLLEGPVDEDVISDGMTVAPHMAMPAGTPPDQLTYERNPASAAYVAPGDGDRYHPGGILGAPRNVFLDFSREVDRMCKADGDYTPVWQDESYVNRILIDHPPALVLDERYCAWWNAWVPDARIRNLNKTTEEMQWRDSLGKEAAAA